MPTLKAIFEGSGERDAVKLSALSGKSIAYVKKFLNANVAELEAVNNETKLDFKKYEGFVPSGSKSNNHYQADITFLHDFKRLRDNKKHIGILTVLNTTTRKAYARGIKSTENDDTVKMFGEILEEIEKEGGVVETLRTDGGSEFQTHFKELLFDHQINHEVSEAHTHNWLARTNRFHRTLKQMIRSMFALNGNQIWFPHLQKLIDDYNKTPTQAFRNIPGFKHPPNNKNEKPYYIPISPAEMEKNTDDFKDRIHQQETKKAADVHIADGYKLKVGDYVRLLNPLTKEQILLNGKFAKKSLENSWSTRVYKIIARTGPDFWRIDDDEDEIKQWTTRFLKKTTKAAYDNQVEAVETKAKQNKQKRVSKAKDEEDRNIAPSERKTVPARTRNGSKRVTRAAAAEAETKRKTRAER
jgi:hypothetical protein